MGMWKNSIEFFRISLFVPVVYKWLKSCAKKAHFPYPIEILFLNLCGSSVSHLFFWYLYRLWPIATSKTSSSAAFLLGMAFDIQGHYETKEGHTGDKSDQSREIKLKNRMRGNPLAHCVESYMVCWRAFCAIRNSVGIPYCIKTMSLR